MKERKEISTGGRPNKPENLSDKKAAARARVRKKLGLVIDEKPVDSKRHLSQSKSLKDIGLTRDESSDSQIEEAWPRLGGHFYTAAACADAWLARWQRQRRED